MMKTAFVKNIAISSRDCRHFCNNSGTRQRGTSVSIGVLVGAMPSVIPRMKKRGS